MKKLMSAFVAVACLTGAASAQLTGTSMDINQQFKGQFMTATMGPHTYGSTTNYPDPNFAGFSWNATSPAPTPPAGFDSHIFCDYAAFGLPDFAATNTTMMITGIDVNVAANSARVYSSNNVQVGTVSNTSNSITAIIAVDDLLAGPTDTMIVAWDNEGGGACYADCTLVNNATGAGLNVADFICFQTQYSVGNAAYADCTLVNQGTGAGLNVADFICYQTRYSLGCP